MPKSYHKSRKTVDDFVNALRGRGLRPKWSGSQWESPCPSCKGKDRFRVHEINGTVIAKCRRCDMPFGDVLALLFDIDTSGAGSNGGGPPTPTYIEGPEWVCGGPDGASFIHTRREEFEDARYVGKKFRWQHGARGKRLIYRAASPGSGSDRVVVCEGEAAADALARLLPDVRVLGTVCGASTVPDEDVLEWGIGEAPGGVLLWPDDDEPGRKQMTRIREILPSARIIDPGKLPGAWSKGAGRDAADWTPPEGIDVWETLRKASVEALSEPAGAAAPPEMPALLKGIIPDKYLGNPLDTEMDVCDAVVAHAGDRLKFLVEERIWAVWRDGRGWTGLHPRTLQAGIQRFGWQNVGSLDKKGNPQMRPRQGAGRRLAGAVAETITGYDEVFTPAAEWDPIPHIVGLPNGSIRNLKERTTRRAKPGDRIRRRLGAMPADDWRGSLWAKLAKHVLPDEGERLWLQRRLGAALARVGGLDHIIWLYGPPRSGKGSLLDAIIHAFGKSASGIPAHELVTGGRRSHSAWLYRLQGMRLLHCDDAPQRDIDAGVIKRLVGSIVSAQPMGGETVDFRIDAPLIVTSNYPPSLPASDRAMLRRLVPVECGASIIEPDETLRTGIVQPDEQARVLRWLIDGAEHYFEHGLGQLPQSITDRAGDVAADAPMTEFVESFRGVEEVSNAIVYQRWQDFKRQRGEAPNSNKRMTESLKMDYGWTQRHTQKGRVWRPVHRQPKR